MRSHTQLITSFIFALLVFYLAFNSHAISSDLPKLPPPVSGKYGTPDTPKYFVPPPPFSEDIFPLLRVP